MEAGYGMGLWPTTGFWQTDEESYTAPAGVPALDTLMAALDAKDRYTASHCRRVSVLAHVLAVRLDLGPIGVRTVVLAALYHDIGKIAIMNSVLNKPGALTEDERSVIAAHPTVGGELVEGLLVANRAAWVIKQHHESWDGSGYPMGLTGQEILPESRILRVCDVYDALISDRPYRPAYSPLEATSMVEAGIGTEFEPDVGEVFLEFTSRLRIAA